MAAFFEQIATQEPSAAEARSRRWIYIPYDRLHDAVGPLADADPQHTVLVFMESLAKGTRRPYHKKKLTLVLSAMRHFALEQAQRGCRIVYGASPTSFSHGLLELQNKWQWQDLTTNRPAERELRTELQSAQAEGLRITFAPDTAWLSTSADFTTAFPNAATKPLRQRYLMDTFYRHMRQKTGLLMERAHSTSAPKPVGGKYSLDAENRKPWRNEIAVPIRPTFAPDDLTREVIAMILERHPDTFGSLDNFDLAVTRADAETAWRFALERLLPWFGPWEDAMSTQHPDLFHSLTSPLLNLTLLRPQQLVEDVAAAHAEGLIPLASAEGFIRQVLGWREFMRHLHEATDGFRTLDPLPQDCHPEQSEGPAFRMDQNDHDSETWVGASPNHLNANLSLPPVYWGKPSGMNCMDTVVSGVIANGWSHHITRLMVLSNLATLCGFSPRELTDWFWFAYIDAYDWVVEPNVLGMATFSDGGLTATKPYISGAAYINKMSDFCGRCSLNPKQSLGPGSCPFTALYWSFLERHEALLAPLNRMSMPLATLRKKLSAEREALRKRAQLAIDQLGRGDIVT
ncbi:cryptochrome/photolyase family protein [Granulicella paludicola]|uniref:cryptochrome/photolyase family protein n=1 Tax=Granulicella paludicola TaxID=474951 RepID=UPI0021E0305E|nr:cryptochrome/photolyase family protein [Granulicella paludicola]